MKGFLWTCGADSLTSDFVDDKSLVKTQIRLFKDEELPFGMLFIKEIAKAYGLSFSLDHLTLVSHIDLSQPSLNSPQSSSPRKRGRPKGSKNKKINFSCNIVYRYFGRYGMKRGKSK